MEQFEKPDACAKLSEHAFAALGYGLEDQLGLKSRVHAVPERMRLNAQLWVKRDDELSPLAGGKYRKYASLLPFLRSRGFKEAICVGGAHSNHLAALLPALRERGIAGRVVMRGEPELPVQGNSLFIRALAGGPDAIRWVLRENWQEAEAIAQDWAEARRAVGIKAFVVAEGGACLPALPGAASLGYDIARNEKALGIGFRHVFIDAGTGFSASALALALGTLGHAASLHVVGMACDSAAFFRALAYWQALVMERCLKPNFPEPIDIEFHTPTLAPRFGQVNTEVLREVLRIGQMYGVWTEPVYGAKLWHTALQVIHNHKLAGDILIVNSSGPNGLWGFADKLKRLVVGQQIQACDGNCAK